MVETEINMKSIISSFCLLVLCMAFLPGRVAAQEYDWKSIAIDGSRSGCKAVTLGSAKESIGRREGKAYVAPSGLRMKGRTAKIAKLLLDSQDEMEPLKVIIGYAPENIYKAYPESPLSNLFIDRIMAAVEKESGKKMDMGIGNFGGIRKNAIYKDILVDDICSMFPFSNQIAYVVLKGSYLKNMVEKMARTSFQVLGGVKIDVVDKKVTRFEIGGSPVEDDKEYYVATISFLLGSGDSMYLANEALEVRKFDKDIDEVFYEWIGEMTASGKDIVYGSDSRITITNTQQK